MIPNDPEVYARAIIQRRAHLQRPLAVRQIATCPSLELKNPEFSEPNPYNPEGNLQRRPMWPPYYKFDMTSRGH